MIDVRVRQKQIADRSRIEPKAAIQRECISSQPLEHATIKEDLFTIVQSDEMF
jgi:hypothetical protein